MSKTDKIKPDASIKAVDRKRNDKIVRRRIHQALKTKDVDDVGEIVESLCQRTSARKVANKGDMT